MRLLVLAAFFLLAVTVAHGQDDVQESKGTFVTYISGREAARESYTFAPQPDGTLRAECEIAPAQGPPQKLVTVATRTRPLSFTAEVGGTKVYAAEFGEGTVKVRVAGQPDRDVPTKATVVLENLLWHQFHFLFAQYDRTKGGLQTFTFFSPSNQRDFEITVERLDAQGLTVNGRRVATEHYRLVTNQQLTIETWVTADRVPVFFTGAGGQLKGVRVGYEEFEKSLPAGAQRAAEYSPPPYAAPSSFTEREVTVGAGAEWALPGTLTLPTGRGPFPAVVLVHGSGPNDRDETILASKPFRDLAWGLASQGIAVLRYDKRTLVHGAKFAALGVFTVKEETIDDALAAVRLLRQTPSVDPERVFLLGHSLGAYLEPRIAALDPRLAGVIVMAGPTTPLEDAFVRQYEYLFSLDGTVSDEERKFLDDARRQTARVKGLTVADRASKQLLHGAPPAYWLDLRAYDAVAAAQKLKIPLLVLQGERDYNVTMEDFRGWRRLAGGKSVTLKSYPKLDHLFLEGEGPAAPADNARPRNIPSYVITDIAAFIKRRSAAARKIIPPPRAAVI